MIAGVDEVGRGPLAGPVYACAVIFPCGYFHPAVRDSKKLSPEVRTDLAGILQNSATALRIGQASPAEVDRINIRQASLLAMQRAITNLPVQPDFILVDGCDLPEFRVPAKAVVQGDDKSFTIAAASIVAKVLRDDLMRKMHQRYPGYGLDCNKGYGTAQHIAALKSLGPTPLHRQTFITKIIFQSGVVR